MNSLRRFFVCVFLVFGFQSLILATGVPMAKVSGGEFHTLVLAENGTIYSCGDNSNWQLGFGGDTYDDKNLLIQVKGVSGIFILQNVTHIAAGWKHSLFLNQNGNVLAVGSDGCGQLGNGDIASSSSSAGYVLRGEQDATATDPSNLHNIIAISAGRSGEHSLAVDQDGHVWAWGKADTKHPYLYGIS